MLISLRSDGTAVMLLPSHVYQGSNVANVFVTAPFPNTTVLQVGFTLPNGTTASAPMTYVQDSENNLVVWQYTIDSPITNEAGAASVSITATTQTGQVIASQSIPFTIEATTLPVLPDVPSQDEYTLILQYLQQNSANIATLQGQISTIEADVATANDNASEALSTAQSAESIAQQAQTTANGLAASIAQANTTAGNALNTAQNAQTIAQGLQTSKQDVTDNALTTTSKTVVGAINENAKAIEGLRQDFINEAHFRGYFATNAEVEETPANLNDFAYSAESGTVWIYGADGWSDSGKPVPDQTTPLADTVPLMDGTGAPGTATSASRADHVHPTDTSRASQSDLQTEISNRTAADNALSQQISDIVDGTTTVAQATNAQTATTATNAGNVTSQINGNAISTIFETDGRTVKQATNATNAENGIPAGGASGEVLIKKSSANYDCEWSLSGSGAAPQWVKGVTGSNKLTFTFTDSISVNKILTVAVSMIVEFVYEGVTYQAQILENPVKYSDNNNMAFLRVFNGICFSSDSSQSLTAMFNVQVNITDENTISLTLFVIPNAPTNTYPADVTIQDSAMYLLIV